MKSLRTLSPGLWIVQGPGHVLMPLVHFIRGSIGQKLCQGCCVRNSRIASDFAPSCDRCSEDSSYSIHPRICGRLLSTAQIYAGACVLMPFDRKNRVSAVKCLQNMMLFYWKNRMPAMNCLQISADQALWLAPGRRNLLWQRLRCYPTACPLSRASLGID